MYDDMEKYDAANATSLCDELLSTCEAGFTLTTAYSGLGAAETVAVQIVEEVRLRRKGSLASNFAPVVVHAACDLLRESHTALENHEPQSRPRHMFRNVLDRLFPEDKQHLILLQNKCLKEGKQVRNNLREAMQRQGIESKQVVRIATKRIGDRMFAQMCKFLDKVEFRDVSECTVHPGCDCPWIPRADESIANRLWIEAAGSTCVAWSAMGSGKNWLHESTLPCLVWAYSMRFAEPDGVLHECTPTFQQQKLFAILNSGRGGNDPTPRYHVGRQSQVARYKMQSHVINPVDRHIPTSRRRRYTMFFCDHVMGFVEGIGCEQVYQRIGDPPDTMAVYMVATEAMIADAATQAQKKHGVEAGDLFSDTEAIEPQYAWSSGEYIQSQGFLALARERHFLVNGEWQVPVVPADLSQTPGFSKSVSSLMCPCLLRHTHLVDLVGQRDVQVPELFLIQGFPHPALVSKDDAKGFPFVCTDFLPETKLKQMLGNTMHLSSVGDILGFMLAASSKNLRDCV